MNPRPLANMLLLVAMLCLWSLDVSALMLRQNGETLDCAGGEITEQVRVHGPATGITVRNCRLMAGLVVANLRAAMSRTGDLQRSVQTHDDVSANTPWRRYEEGDPAWRFLWDGSPAGVLIENTTIEGGGNDTVFIGAYVRDVTMRGVVIADGSATALYLAGGATGNRIEGRSLIMGDVHLDGAFANVITGNNLIAGSVRLYKNCGEHGGFPDEDPQHNPNARPVVTPADGNRIVGNTIRGNVHIAARQSEHLEYQFCSDASPYPDDVYEWVTLPSDGWPGWRIARLPLSRIYWLDYARGNVIRRNSISGRIIVEDDRNVIWQPGVEVLVGAELRARWLDWPVRMP